MTFIIKKQINKKHKAMLKPQCLGVSMIEVTQSKRKYTIHRSLAVEITIVYCVYTLHSAVS